MYDLLVLNAALERLKIAVDHASPNQPIINEGMKINLITLTNIVKEIIRRDAE
jgi:hypothetical protein